MLFFAVTGRDSLHRKPSPKMFRFYEERYGSVNLDKSFYCGDAAGRLAAGQRKKDHSNVDLRFAHNTGLKFFTPEELFLGEDIKSLPSPG